MRRGFAPHFRHLDDLFAPQNFTLSTILFRSCWVPFRNPPFSACRQSFCPKNWKLTKSIILFRSCWVPFWTSSGAPLLILTRSATEIVYKIMMTSSNGKISALLTLCVGNPPVTGGFSWQRQVTRNVDISLDLHLDKRLSKQSRRRRFETPSRSLWLHCND